MDRDLAIFLAVALAIVTALGFGVVEADKKSCEAHWANSGMQSRWSFFGDCQVQTKSGAWVPEDFYRVKREDQ